MFTGLIEEVGRVRSVEPVENGRRIAIEAATVLDGLSIGDSVSVDGACQTVVGLAPWGFTVVAVATTLERTTFGSFAPGRPVNLERALAFGGRLGGHLVQGHVDGVGEVLAVERHGEHHRIDLSLPPVVAEVTVLHGSIAVNGVSMTVNALGEGDVAQIAVIPHTWAHTNLSALRPGDRVNLEGDLLGKFVVNYLKRAGWPETGSPRPAGPWGRGGVCCSIESKTRSRTSATGSSSSSRTTRTARTKGIWSVLRRRSRRST